MLDRCIVFADCQYNKQLSDTVTPTKGWKNFSSDFREKFTICSSWLLEFKSVGIFAISSLFTKLLQFFYFLFFNSVQLFDEQILQNIAFAPLNSDPLEFVGYRQLFLKYKGSNFRIFNSVLTVYMYQKGDLKSPLHLKRYKILILKINWISFFLEKAETHSLPSAFILYQSD